MPSEFFVTLGTRPVAILMAVVTTAEMTVDEESPLSCQEVADGEGYWCTLGTHCFQIGYCHCGANYHFDAHDHYSIDYWDHFHSGELMKPHSRVYFATVKVD